MTAAHEVIVIDSDDEVQDAPVITVNMGGDRLSLPYKPRAKLFEYIKDVVAPAVGVQALEEDPATMPVLLWLCDKMDPADMTLNPLTYDHRNERLEDLFEAGVTLGCIKVLPNNKALMSWIRGNARAEGNRDVCSICRCVVGGEAQPLCLTRACAHKFHPICLFQVQDERCPVCRVPLGKDGQYFADEPFCFE